MSTPEHLNLWDRLFNRYRRELHDRGEESWATHDSAGVKRAGTSHVRKWIEYKVIDRVTGSETIEKVYLN